MAYFRYKIKNIEPIRIADDSISQNGQALSLRHIPGSTIRGMVINKIAESPDFEENKALLFSDKTRFMNAYLYENDHELIPSPKGFYEDKTVAVKKAIDNVVVDGEFSEGMKRAGIGRYCYIEDECLYYYNISTGSDMKIRINNVEGSSEVFRNEYMVAGNTFVGYIRVDDSVKDIIASAFGEEIIIGNARSQGLGKCKVIEAGFIADNVLPYEAYATDTDASEKCYMMLASSTLMRNSFGEFVGIDTDALAEKLGVTGLTIENCATTTVTVKGYNRNWGNKIPSVNMYEQGSVFKLSFDGNMSIDKMRDVMNSGIGVRKNEGFGSVIFLKNYENIKYKQEGSKKAIEHQDAVKMADDDKTLSIIAATYYRQMLKKEMQLHIIGGVDNITIASSQKGKVRSLLAQNRYDAINGTEIVRKYFVHAKEKSDNQNIQRDKIKIEPFMNKIMNILDKPLEETLGLEYKDKVMGIAVNTLISGEELQQMKFDYIIELIKYDNKKEGR